VENLLVFLEPANGSHTDLKFWIYDLLAAAGTESALERAHRKSQI